MILFTFSVKFRRYTSTEVLNLIASQILVCGEVTHYAYVVCLLSQVVMPRRDHRLVVAALTHVNQS